MDTDKLVNEQKMELEGEPGLTIAPCQVRPESRGRVRIVSSDPTGAIRPSRPTTSPASLDQEVVVASLKIGPQRSPRQAALAP